MNITSAILAVVLWLVCIFAALVYFARRIASVRKYTEQAIERANTRTDERLKNFDNSYIDQFCNLAKRVKKLEDSKICVPESSCSRSTSTDEEGKTSLYAITLEDPKICVLESSCSRSTGTDEEGKTSLYAITKVGYSTIVVSLTEDEVAVLNSFIDWAELEDDFIAEKIDENYIPEDWRNKE